MHDLRMAEATPYPLPAGSGLLQDLGFLSFLAAPGGDPHADEEATRCGAAPGATPDQPGAPPAAAADRACQQQCQALSDREGPHASVEGGCPRSGDGTLLCLAQLPGAFGPVAAN